MTDVRLPRCEDQFIQGQGRCGAHARVTVAGCGLCRQHANVYATQGVLQLHDGRQLRDVGGTDYVQAFLENCPKIGS